MSDHIMTVSSAENKSKPYYDEYFKDKFVFKYLPVLDTLMPWIKTLVENKFYSDSKDLVRLSDEATRSNYPNLVDWNRHLIWVHNNPDLNEYKRLNGICQKAGILLHHCYYIEPQSSDMPYYTSNWVDKIKQIRTGHYLKGFQRHKQPSKKLLPLARMFCLTHLVSEDIAQLIAEELKIMQINCPRDCFTNNNELIFKQTIHKIMGFNKDGSEKKIALNLIEEWFEGVKPKQ